MHEPSTARWWRRVGVAGLGACALALVGWRVAVHVIERPPTPRPPGAVAMCRGTLDPAYVAAAEEAGDELLAMLVERRIPGLAIAVAANGRLVWSQGFGYANLESRTPACADTQFRLQSVSKLLTTAAMARLIERGALDLDAAVRTYVPDLPGTLGAVTGRQLASHRAGVRHYRDDNESLNTTAYDTATASLETFRGDPLLFKPGTGESYSSFGFVLLSAALEGASGLDFPALLRQEVVGPLGLDRTEAERRDAPALGRATFYDNVTPYSTDGRVVPSPALDVSFKWAAGGLLSTADNLARFGVAHVPPFNEGFLRDETLALLFAPRPWRPVPMAQGLGWNVGRDHRARRVWLQFGAGSGGTAVLAIYPDRQVSVAILANLGHARFPLRRLLAIVRLFVGDPLEPVAWLASAGLFAAAIVVSRRGQGRYRAPPEGRATR
jgi:CubicO group peptidase (beta-lactamase class C family)